MTREFLAMRSRLRHCMWIKARILEVIQVNPAVSQGALLERGERNRVVLLISMARQKTSSCPIRPNCTIAGYARANFAMILLAYSYR